MMKKYFFVIFVTLGFLAVPLSVASQTATAHGCFGAGANDGHPVNIAECADAGACLDSEGRACPAASSNTDKVNSALKLALNVFSLIVGFGAVIMIMVGGFKYVISSGDSNNINSAKNTILYAIIGLVIVALAQIIVKFVLAKATVK